MKWGLLDEYHTSGGVDGEVSHDGAPCARYDSAIKKPRRAGFLCKGYRD